MLLLIVLSNTAFFLYAGDFAGGGDYPTPEHMADTITQFLMVVLLDVRVYPLFAFLVGYGIVQLFTRRVASGASEDEAATVIRRRNQWLFLFGFVQAALLLGSEVLAAYGLVGLILCALFLRSGERRTRGWAMAGTLVLLTVFALATVLVVVAHLLDPAVTGGSPPASEIEGDRTFVNGAGESDYLVSVMQRLMSWTALLFVNTFGVVLPTAMLLGMWAARRRIIEEAGQHLRLLRTVAMGGFLIGLLGAMPSALKVVGVWDPPPLDGLTGGAMTMMTWTTGLAGGLGYVAIFVLVAERLTRSGPTPAPVGAVSALGKRSLSGYLTHSIVMAPVLAAWGLGLGAHLTSATMALFAFGLWLATVIAASVMDRYGVRGPFEVLLRYLIPHKTPRPTAAPGSSVPEGSREN